MTELETVQRAKMYLDRLAQGVDPLTGAKTAPTDIVNNPRISKCLAFTSDVLRRVIEYGGVPKPKIPDSEKQPFAITTEQLERYEYPQWGISVTELTARINALIDTDTMQGLKYTAVTDFLTESGYLETYINPQGRNSKRPTQSGAALGITTETRTGRDGQYIAVLYNRNAQHFILENIGLIVGSVERYKQKRSEERAFSNRPWSAKEVLRLDELFRQGAQVGDIARELNRSTTSVNAMLAKLNVDANQ